MTDNAANKPIVKADVQYLLNNIYDDINELQSSVLDSNTINRLVTLADTAVTRSDVVTSTQNGVCTPAMLSAINSISTKFPFKAIKSYFFNIETGDVSFTLPSTFTKTLPNLFIMINGTMFKEATPTTSANISTLYVSHTSAAIFNQTLKFTGRTITLTGMRIMPYISILIAEPL